MSEVNTTVIAPANVLNIFAGLNGRKMNDTARAAYAHGSGAGNDAFGYRRGSGASAVAFVYAINGAYNANAPLTKGATAVQQLHAVESDVWGGRTRGAVEQQIASLLGGQYLHCVGGAYALTPKGEGAAAFMLAEMGLSPLSVGPTAEELAALEALVTAEAERVKAEDTAKLAALEALVTAEAERVKAEDTAKLAAETAASEAKAAHDKSANTAKNRLRAGK